MACRITELVLDAHDPDLLAGFWCTVVGYVELDRVDGSIEIGPPEAGFGGPQPTIVFDRTHEPKRGKLRLHIDVNATDRAIRKVSQAGRRGPDLAQSRMLSVEVARPVRIF